MYKYFFYFLFYSTSLLNAQTIDVTFNVDMQNEIVSPNGVHIAASFQNWDPSTTQLTDLDGDNVYTITISLFSDSSYEYKYINGNIWGNDENVSGGCGAGNGNRILQTDTINQNLIPVYFSSCTNSHLGCTDFLANNYDSTAISDDGSCTYTVSVEFNVDMNNEVVSSSGVHIAGAFTSWSTDSIEMLDLNGDGIYTVSVDLNQGWYYEYKYLNGDNVGSYEFLASWESCNNSGNRFLTTDSISIQVLPIVCFSSCTTCPIYGCTDSTSINYNILANVDDSSCIYPVFGCMDVLSCNYNNLATIEDSSCYYLSVDLGNDTALCSSTNMVLGVSGDYFSYLWNTLESTSQITISSNGMYSVLVSDSLGCTTSDTILVSLAPSPLVDIGNDQILCPGESLILDAGSGWNYYLWSDSSILQNLVVDTIGLYFVTVTDSIGCEGSDYVNITMDSLSVSGFTYVINGLTVNFMDISSYGNAYLWDFVSDGTFTDSTMGDVSFQYPSSGMYDVTLLVINDCGTDTFNTEINLTNSKLETIDSNFQIYPNPSKNQLCIEVDKLSIYAQFTITDINGKIMLTQQLNDVKTIFDVSSFVEGIYIISLQRNGFTTHQKLIIN